MKYTDPDGEFIFLAVLLANPATVYMVANTLWDLGNVALSSYYFAKDRSGENAAYLAGDFGALLNPVMFGIGGTLNAVKNQQAAKFGNINKTIRFRHVTDRNYTKINSNGFDAKETYFLDISDENSRIASNKYSIERQNGNDFGEINVDLPENIFKDLDDKGLIHREYKTMPDPTDHSKILEYNDIIFLPESMDIINQYKVNK